MRPLMLPRCDPLCGRLADRVVLGLLARSRTATAVPPVVRVETPRASLAAALRARSRWHRADMSMVDACRPASWKVPSALAVQPHSTLRANEIERSALCVLASMACQRMVAVGKVSWAVGTRWASEQAR